MIINIQNQLGYQESYGIKQQTHATTAETVDPEFGGHSIEYLEY